MSRPVHYKKPRKINTVSVSMTLISLLIGYLIYQYLPLYFLRQESYRVLDETSSSFSGTSTRYLHNQDQMLRLRSKLATNLHQLGIKDPNMEVWIEPTPDELEIRFGVLYSVFIEWPYDLIQRQEEVNEIEITCNRLSRQNSWTCFGSTQDSGQ